MFLFVFVGVFAAALIIGDLIARYLQDRKENK